MIPAFSSSSSSFLNKKSLTLFATIIIHHNYRYLHSPSPLPSSVVSEDTCLQLLSHCNSKSLKHGLCVHSPIVKLGLHTDLFLTNNLLSLYSKCSSPYSAHKMFDEMPHRDVVSWTGIISAYVQRGYDEDALELFQEMFTSGEATPNKFTYSTMIRCASSLGDFDLGMCIHSHITKLGLDTNVIITSGLLDFYAKCDDELESALRIFALMNSSSRDGVSWTSMISALLESGDSSAALQLFMSMIASGVSPNEFTFVKVLMASSFLGLQSGCMVHAQFLVRGLQLNIVVKTALLDMYCKCSCMRSAQKVMHGTPDSDVALWTAMVAGYTQAGDCTEAVATFRAMEIASGVLPNPFTFAALLKASTSCSSLELGMQIHARVAKSGLDNDVSVGNALVDLYAKLSPSIDDLVRGFQSLRSPNVVSWTALIAGLSRHEQVREAFAAFEDMQAAGVKPNCYTIASILKGCGSSAVEALPHVMRVHAYVVKTNLVASDVDLVMRNSLVDAYTKSRAVYDAWHLAHMMLPWGDVFTYTSLAKGFNQIGHHSRALDAITPILRGEHVSLDGFSLSTFLSVAAGLTSIELGEQLHCFAVKSGLSSAWVSVSNSIIDMYSKCGRIDEARRAFRAIPDPNVVSWNGLISGLASNGRFSDALSTFEDMRLVGAAPDSVTMLVVLYACSHGGLVDLGVEYFDSMKEVHGLVPRLDHYVCLVDLLGRAGRLEEAECAIETMGFEPKDPLIYKTLLNCCKVHGNLVMGECMARRSLDLDPSDPAVYVMLAGLYDDAGKTEMGEQTRKMMRDRGLSKCPGESWAESRGMLQSWPLIDKSSSASRAVLSLNCSGVQFFSKNK